MSTPTPTPTKHEIQQLKSVRDDLCRRFRDNDNLYQITAPTSVRRQLKIKINKHARQITSLNLIIKHFETKD